MKRIKEIVAFAVLACLALTNMQTGLASQDLSGPTYYVSPSPIVGGPFGCSSPNYNTIQAAVSAASSGYLIIVCPGAYVEQVTIGTSLKLKGSGSLRTTIQLPSCPVQADTYGMVNVLTVSGGASVDVSGFTISGPGCNGNQATTSFASGNLRINNGIFVQGGSKAIIHNNVITHIRNEPLSPFDGLNGVGVRVGCSANRCGTGTATTGSATISHNVVSDYQGGGITVDNPGSSATITGNTVTGVGETTVTYQNGIILGHGASGTITGNIVSGNECDASYCGPDLDVQGGDGGIGVDNGPAEGPVSATVSNNIVYSNDYGIGVQLSDNGVTVAKNNVFHNRFANMYLYYSKNDKVSYNTIWVSDPVAAAASCSVSSNCYGSSYTLGIDVIDYSTGNLIYRNSVRVTADKYAVLLDSSSSGNSVTYNTLNANKGLTHGNAAVRDLGSGNTISKND